MKAILESKKTPTAKPSTKSKVKIEAAFNVDYVEIGRCIRKFRHERGLTLEVLAEKANMTKEHLGHIELATTKLSLILLLSLSHALQVNINNLLGANGFEAGDILRDELTRVFETATPDDLSLCLCVCEAIIRRGDTSTKK